MEETEKLNRCMITYIKGEDIDAFFKNAHLKLLENSFVHLRLEPGDLTRY